MRVQTQEEWALQLSHLVSQIKSAARSAGSEEDPARWLGLMRSPDGLTRSLGSVVEQFLRHRDRKFLFEDGTAIRRRILVRRRNIRHIGKEAHRLEASVILGKDASGGRTAIYDDVVAWILALPLSWAPKRGIDRANFARLRRKLRAGKVPKGHGASLFKQVGAALRSDNGREIRD